MREWRDNGESFGGDGGGRNTSDIIYILVDYYVHPFLGVFVFGYLGGGEGFGHFGGLLSSIFYLRCSMRAVLWFCLGDLRVGDGLGDVGL